MLWSICHLQLFHVPFSLFARRVWECGCIFLYQGGCFSYLGSSVDPQALANGSRILLAVQTGMWSFGNCLTGILCQFFIGDLLIFTAQSVCPSSLASTTAKLSAYVHVTIKCSKVICLGCLSVVRPGRSRSSRIDCFDLQGVLSYVILRPLMTAIGVFGQLCGVYGDALFRFDRLYIYTTAVNNVAQVCGTYGAPTVISIPWRLHGGSLWMLASWCTVWTSELLSRICYSTSSAASQHCMLRLHELAVGAR